MADTEYLGPNMQDINQFLPSVMEAINHLQNQLMAYLVHSFIFNKSSAEYSSRCHYAVADDNMQEYMMNTDEFMQSFFALYYSDGTGTGT